MLLGLGSECDPANAICISRYMTLKATTEPKGEEKDSLHIKLCIRPSVFHIILADPRHPASRALASQTIPYLNSDTITCSGDTLGEAFRGDVCGVGRGGGGCWSLSGRITI